MTSFKKSPPDSRTPPIKNPLPIWLPTDGTLGVLGGTSFRFGPEGVAVVGASAGAVHPLGFSPSASRYEFGALRA